MIDRVVIAEFLRTRIIDKSFIYVDLWTIVHIMTAFLIIMFLTSFTKKPYKRLSWLLVLLVFWEGFEFLNYGVIKSNLFFPETFVDGGSDLVFGMIGGLVTEYLLKVDEIPEIE